MIYLLKQQINDAESAVSGKPLVGFVVVEDALDAGGGGDEEVDEVTALRMRERGTRL